jgi:hypothetical protein
MADPVLMLRHWTMSTALRRRFADVDEWRNSHIDPIKKQNEEAIHLFVLFVLLSRTAYIRT